MVDSPTRVIAVHPAFTTELQDASAGWNQNRELGHLITVGRDDEFAELARDRWRALVHTAMLFGCNLADAEDATQIALMKAYANWPKVARAKDRNAYVARILVNTIRAGRRRRWHGESPVAEVPENAIADDTVEAVHADGFLRMLGRLSSVHREVLVLRYYLQLDPTQIATVLGIPPGTVKSRTARALAVLAADEELARRHDRKS